MKQLDEALGGRDRLIGFKEPPNFRDNMLKFKQGIKEMKEKYRNYMC
jgi:hypothetical protein